MEISTTEIGNQICAFLNQKRTPNLAPLMFKGMSFRPSKIARLTIIASFDFEHKMCSFALVISANFL